MSIKKGIVLFVAVLFSAQFVHAQWQVYNCNVLPENFTKYDSTFHEDQTSSNLENGTADLLTLEEHPDEAGNMIIRVDSENSGDSEMWEFPWVEDPSEDGATLVFRAKGVDGGTRVHDLYVGNGVARERLTGRLNGDMEWNKSDVDTDTTFSNNYDIFEWHTFTITISPNNQFKLYIDDNPDHVLLSLGGDSEEYNGWKFGDGGSDHYRTLYDWFAWRTDGEYPPAEGREIPTGIEDEIANTPAEFTLAQNYPNPFNPETRISYTLQKETPTSIKVYDSNGKLVETLVNERKSAGTHTVEFNGAGLPSGIYFYTLSAGQLTQTKKMILLK
ncbi:MAG: T9SS type A sorting domain-containing protein [Candidatus Marinimicrobia bacterium]|nr:T9SS type A sorting domain-containing protein [Candidatus Neomarinimicrobiota bacterium]MCF7827402.1 T9SS type A sorting domain-containing protein [Candidatus Neomarinimicrobiota bacterium]MCF7881365.1 T9SS type A sorting domain-containing protein [Candidatus Neomarinimicrobiota bacterium]